MTHPFLDPLQKGKPYSLAQQLNKNIHYGKTNQFYPIDFGFLLFNLFG